VLDSLGSSHVEEIHVLGRRGPAQATFTTKELRELGELLDADVVVDPSDVIIDEASENSIATDKAVARNVDVIREWSARAPGTRRRKVFLHFCARPVELLGEGRVSSVMVEKTMLDGTGNATGTGVTYEIPANLVVRSVGYRGTALEEVPFDAKSNVIPHLDGRVVLEGVVVPGEYVAGWIKRGPTGIIGTNKKDATATVAALVEDAVAGRLPVAGEPSASAFDALLAQRGVHAVSTQGWRAIDAAERSLGAHRNRPRTTIHELSTLLAAAGD